MNNQFVVLAVTIGIAASVSAVQAQHGHLNAGARSTNQNSQLFWANGAEFIADSGYVKTLTYTNGARFAGYYEGGITPTALPATAAHAGPDVAAAAPGSYLQFSLACLEAPPGGTFGFWEGTSTNPAISLLAGETSTNLWPLTESDGSPGADPYGHIHGRRFTATRLGFYKIGFTAVDTSTNGPGGSAIHTPSQQLPIWFQAGPNIRQVQPDSDHTHIRFGAVAAMVWQLEAAGSLSSSSIWTPIGAPVTGDDFFHEVTDDTPVGLLRFYRLQGTPIVP